MVRAAFCKNLREIAETATSPKVGGRSEVKTVLVTDWPIFGHSRWSWCFLLKIPPKSQGTLPAALPSGFRSRRPLTFFQNDEKIKEVNSRPRHAGLWTGPERDTSPSVTQAPKYNPPPSVRQFAPTQAKGGRGCYKTRGTALPTTVCGTRWRRPVARAWQADSAPGRDCSWPVPPGKRFVSGIQVAALRMGD
jgi:hypothetical protein